MEDPPVVPTPTQKRPRDEDADVPPSTPPKATITTEASSPLSPPANIETPSPLKKTQPAADIPASSPASISQQPAKRRKLTEQEKEQQRLDREAKEKLKAEKKAQKELEDEVKAKIAAERKAQKEAKDRLKAEKKAQREEEEKAKAEEKAKKERSQMRLNAFFVKPKMSSGGAQLSTVESHGNSTAHTASLLSDTAGVSTDHVSLPPQKHIQKNALSEYERCFLPFSLPSFAIMAPHNFFMDDANKLEAARSRLDGALARSSRSAEPITLETLKVMLPARGRGSSKNITMTDVIECIHGSSDNPVGLNDNADTARERSLAMLQTMPMKYLHFGEDVRPPYYGTYTKPYSSLQSNQLARNFLARIRQDTNYEYDSEAEWEEPEEGEDLDSEGEDDVDDDADDDMDGFLDDEEDPQHKRRMLSGDLIPVSTGLCWEDTDGVSRLNDGSGAICTELKEFKMEFLFEQPPQSVDPFSTAYWAPEPAPSMANTTKKDAASNGLMQPPSTPLAHRTVKGLFNTMNGSRAFASTSTSKPAIPKKLVPDDQMAAFKAEIEGKDLTKLGMIETLKKAFPKLPKQMITQTLNTVAARVGPTEKEKRWVLINS